jgi:predicted aspartyl protease
MRGRYYCSWVVMLTSLAVAEQPSSVRFLGTDACRESETTIRFDLYRGYLILAQGSAGPLNKLNLLLDTGTSSTILSQRLARKLGLVEKPASIGVANGRVQARTTTVPCVGIGPIRRNNFPVLIRDLDFLQRALLVPVDAVIGLDVLGQVSFMVDYTSRKIHFGSPIPLPNSIPLQWKGGLATVDAELNHAPVHLLLDTGASSLILFETRIPRSVSGQSIGVVKQSTNLNGNFERKQVWLHSLKLGGAEFSHETAFVVHDRSDTGRDFDGLMSPAALGITRMTVDVERGVLAFSR